MKAAVVVAIFLAFLAVVSCVELEKSTESGHVIQKRGVTITAKPPFPRCVFYECIANCRNRGYKNGGYCTINGCQCLR
ncbi:gallerimycin-like [Achroia grisella]|uniref:gallerimycin-like n=1 Tax=Achroia grisella TaxID=688607 RepID=UPI0027D20F83|nr:gallerimycin-like [Achroia grisella]